MNEVRNVVEKYFKNVPSVQEFKDLKSLGTECKIEELKNGYSGVVLYIKKLKQRLKDNPFANSIKFFKCENNEKEKIVLFADFQRNDDRANFALIEGNHIYCLSGNTIKDGGKNEFANNLDGFVPNSYYHMENVTYRIDEKGRVCETFEYHVTKRQTNRNNERGSMKNIAMVFDGKETDIGGHLVAHSIDGPSEAINIVPMDNTFNKTGEWNIMENFLRCLYQMGIVFWVHKAILYKDTTRRPSHVDTEIEIEIKQPINFTFDCL